jgi:uncharacterized CHY-type Zn-finger protein
MMPSKQFQKRVEDFVCGHCGTAVSGNGYTNHCPKCLWSLHVDIFPGDRAARCGGLMEPVEAFLDHGEWHLTHRCVTCGYAKKNRLSDEDDMEMFSKLFEGK